MNQREGRNDMRTAAILLVMVTCAATVPGCGRKNPYPVAHLAGEVTIDGAPAQRQRQLPAARQRPGARPRA